MPGKLRKVSIYIPEPMAAFFEKYAYHREAPRSKLRGIKIDSALVFPLAFISSSPSRRLYPPQRSPLRTGRSRAGGRQGRGKGVFSPGGIQIIGASFFGSYTADLCKLVLVYRNRNNLS